MTQSFIRHMRLTDNSWAMPSAQAGRASHRAVLRRLGHSAPILIAIFAVSTFAASFISWSAS